MFNSPCAGCVAQHKTLLTVKSQPTCKPRPVLWPCNVLFCIRVCRYLLKSKEWIWLTATCTILIFRNTSNTFVTVKVTFWQTLQFFLKILLGQNLKSRQNVWSRFVMLQSSVCIFWVYLFIFWALCHFHYDPLPIWWNTMKKPTNSCAHSKKTNLATSYTAMACIHFVILSLPPMLCGMFCFVISKYTKYVGLGSNCSAWAADRADPKICHSHIPEPITCSFW